MYIYTQCLYCMSYIIYIYIYTWSQWWDLLEYLYYILSCACSTCISDIPLEVFPTTSLGYIKDPCCCPSSRSVGIMTRTRRSICNLSRQRITTPQSQKVLIECSTKSNVTHTTSRHPVADRHAVKETRRVGNLQSCQLTMPHSTLEQRGLCDWTNWPFFPSFLLLSRLGYL